MGKRGKRKGRPHKRKKTERPALPEKPIISPVLERYSFIIPLLLIPITALLIYSNIYLAVM